jgi:hypothetical protein
MVLFPLHCRTYHCKIQRKPGVSDDGNDKAESEVRSERKLRADNLSHDVKCHGEDECEVAMSVVKGTTETHRKEERARISEPARIIGEG